MEQLRQEYFSDPSKWWDSRNNKTNANSPGFQHKVTRKALWIRHHHKSVWVQEELQRRGLLSSGKGGYEDIRNQMNIYTKNSLGPYNSWKQRNDQMEKPTNKNHGWLENDDDADIDYKNNNAGDAYLALLKHCTQKKDLSKGIQLHDQIKNRGLLENNFYIGSALVNMYAKCGALEKAQEVFDELPNKNVVTWNALIAGYSQNGYGNKALNCFEQMLNEGLSPSSVTFVCVLKACGSIGTLDKGEKLHKEIIDKGFLEKNTSLGNALIDMYAKCGALAKAEEVFNELPYQDVVTWNSLIAGYVHHGYNEQALHSFEQMQQQGFSPNGITFISVLKACCGMRLLEKGDEIYSNVMKNGLLENFPFLGTALVDMFAKCGALHRAQKVFDELPTHDVVSWTALIGGYAEHGHGEEALMCFQQMRCNGISPNSATLVCALKACSSIGARRKGEEIHSDVVKEDLYQNDFVVGTAIVDMYAKCGALLEAQAVFDKLVVRDAISWNALIAGYMQHGYDEEALVCFRQMLEKNLCPTEVTYFCILKVCGNIGAYEMGCELHSEIIRQDLLHGNILLSNALLEMYINCGEVGKAHEVFNALRLRDVVSWNSLMTGYAQHGKYETVFKLFRKMDGILEPDSVTFTIILNTCSHAGLLDDAQTHFEAIAKDYYMVPTLEHYTCMIDLFGRAGHFDKVMSMIDNIPLSADLAVWHTVLDASLKWGNVNIGKLAFDQVVRLDDKDSASYVSLSNIYAAAGMEEDVMKIKAIRAEKNAEYQLDQL